VVIVDSLSKSFGAKIVLDRVSFALHPGDRLALVGANGAGKSTLARLILGELSPDGGKILFKGEIGYLPQDLSAQFEADCTMAQFLRQRMGDLETLALKMHELEERMAEGEEVLHQYAEIQELFERRGGYRSDHRMEELLQGLELQAINPERPIGSLSGGERTRLFLAALLLSSPDLLVLDEPTNHLDEAALDWLESYLERYQNALLLISHDRHFLNRVATQIGEINDGHLTLFQGNYDKYLLERERRFLQEQTRYEKWREEMEELRQVIKKTTFSTAKPRKDPTDRDKLTFRHHGEAAEKSRSSKLKAARQRLEELEELQFPKPQRRWELSYRLNPHELVSAQVIRLNIDGVDWTVHKGERVVITGPNGCGKTTLLNRIAHQEGTLLAPGAVIGYLDQMQGQLDEERSVLEEYATACAGAEETLRADLRKYGLFGGEEVFLKVKELSSGQRQKLQLAKMIASRSNVWLLDEPTNHLDLESIERLERALLDYPITVLAVSHDRRFVERVATTKWAMQPGGGLSQ
jgi:macrolide transport system ATP-binding/permease protein